MNALSLYSGGCDGMGVAAEWAGINTLAYCDNEDACRALLHMRHPEAPIFESDTEVTLDGLRQHGIDPGTIDLVYGAPPCQCASVAGKRLGVGDERNRWPQFLRIVREIRPRWVMAENVPGLLSVNDGWLFGDILRQLAEAGYTVGWQCWSAADVGAPHRRERLFIVAYSGGGRLRGQGICTEQPGRTETVSTSKDVAHTYSDGCKREFGTSPEEGCNAQQINNTIADSSHVAYAGSGELQVGHAEPRTEGGKTTRFTGCSIAMEYPNGERREERDITTGDRQSGHVGGRYAADEYKRPTQSQLGRDIARLPAGLDAIAAGLETQKWPAGKGPYQYDWEPPRVITGMMYRAIRLQMIGNACPPQQYYVMMSLIAAIDKT